MTIILRPVVYLVMNLKIQTLQDTWGQRRQNSKEKHICWTNGLTQRGEPQNASKSANSIKTDEIQVTRNYKPKVRKTVKIRISRQRNNWYSSDSSREKQTVVITGVACVSVRVCVCDVRARESTSQDRQYG